MIVEPGRLMTRPCADRSASVADGPLPVGPAQIVSDAEAGMASLASLDFAESLGRSAAQGLDRRAHAGEAEAIPAATAPQDASTAEDALAATMVVEASIVPAPPLAASDSANASETRDSAGFDGDGGNDGNDGNDGDEARAAPTDAARNLADLMDAMNTHGRADRSTADAAASQIATLLAAHEHRMRGALGSVAQPQRADAAVGGATLTFAPDAVARVAIPGGATPAGLPSAVPSGAPLSMSSIAVEPATLAGTATDGGATHALRAIHLPASFGNMFAGDALAAVGPSGLASNAAVPGGQLGGYGVAGDAVGVSRALSEHVQSMTANGTHEARMRLMPAELGEIGVVVRKSPMQLSVNLQVARPEVLSLVQGTAALLRDMLSQRHAGEVVVSVAGLPQYGGDGASGHARERHSRDDPSAEATPGRALGVADRDGETFQL